MSFSKMFSCWAICLFQIFYCLEKKKKTTTILFVLIQIPGGDLLSV